MKWNCSLKLSCNCKPVHKKILQTAGKHRGDDCGFKYALARQWHSERIGICKIILNICVIRTNYVAWLLA